MLHYANSLCSTESNSTVLPLELKIRQLVYNDNLAQAVCGQYVHKYEFKFNLGLFCTVYKSFLKETDEISSYTLIIPLSKSQIVQKMFNK